MSHDNSDDTRVFRDVASVGDDLKKLCEVSGSITQNEVAILFDYDNLWSLQIAQVYRNVDEDKGYFNILHKNYGALWKLNIGCDFVFADEDFSEYKVIIAPMLFMIKNGLKEKIEKFVESGGIFVTTFGSGIIDEYGLSFFNDKCYPLRRLLGIKAEETDSLYDGQCNYVNMYGSSYRCENYCELAYAEDADVIGTYDDDFYKGMPAVTVNSYGKGRAYYIAADLMPEGYMTLYKEWFKDVVSSDKVVETEDNISVMMRYSAENTYVFIMNFNNEEKTINLSFDDYEVLSGRFDGTHLEPYGVIVLKRKI